MKFFNGSLFSLIKAFFQGATKVLYMILGFISLSVVLIEIIESGSIMDKGVVFIAFWGTAKPF